METPYAKIIKFVNN